MLCAAVQSGLFTRRTATTTTRKITERGFSMGIDKIIMIVGLLVAIVAGFKAFPYSDVLVALFGIVGAWFIAEENRMRFLVAAIALGVSYGALNAIPVVGPWLTSALGGISSLFYAGAATVVVLGIIDRVKP